MTEQIKSVMFWILMSVCTLYLMSPAANSEEKKPIPDQYVKGLENIVASCLTEGVGKPIKVGDDWFLCGLMPLGKFK